MEVTVYLQVVRKGLQHFASESSTFFTVSQYFIMVKEF